MDARLIRLNEVLLRLWNMSTASTPIMNATTSVKYWIASDMAVHTASLSVCSMPIRKKNSIQNRAMECWR